MPKYTSITEIENYLSIKIDSLLKTQVEEWIDSVENYIEKETGRVFVADEEASIRKYDGKNSKKLFIDDCIEITEVKVDDKVITDYLSYPANKLPIMWLERESRFPEGKQNISVKAKWGYSKECPPEIKLATTILTAGIVNYSESKGGDIQSESYGSYSVTYKSEKQWNDFEQAKEIINRYKRILVG